MSAGQSSSSLPVKVRKLSAAYNPREVEGAIRDLVDAMNGGFSCVTFQERHEEPTKTDPLMMLVADGVDWDPKDVGGQTLVIRNVLNSSWRFVFTLADAPTLAVRTFIQTPTSANLAAAVTDETGTGPIVFGNNPQFTGTPYFAQSATVIQTGAATLTPVEILPPNGFIRLTGGAANLTLPTGANLDARITLNLGSALAVDRAFDFSVNASAAGAATLVVAAGITNVGSLVVAAGMSGIFRMRKTAADTFEMQRWA